jgi:hypothetical protein
MAQPDDDTLDDDGALAGATAGDDELDRPVDVMPAEETADVDESPGGEAP